MLVAGGPYLPTEVLQPANPIGGEGAARLSVDLTPRERQVMVQLASGASSKEIGRDLDLAEVTVKLHVPQVLKKIHACNRSEGAAIATKAGLI
jgi:DNA-binding NarL/FixJ family response regulator